MLAHTGQMEDKALELCSCTLHCEDGLWVLVKGAILLGSKERKWDFLPQSPAEPSILFRCFVIHHKPVSLQDVSRVTGIHHCQIKGEENSGTEKSYSNPSYGFPDWEREAVPQLLHSSLSWLTMISTSVHCMGAPNWNCSFQPSGPLLLWTMLVTLRCKKPGLSLSLCCLKSCAFGITPPHGSSRQCNGVSTMYYMRISLACWISDTLQQNTNCLFFFTAVLPSILSIHSPSACRRFTYFTCIGMVEETLLTCRFAFNRHPAQIGIKYICVSNREETRTSCRHK